MHWLNVVFKPNYHNSKMLQVEILYRLAKEVGLGAPNFYPYWVLDKCKYVCIFFGVRISSTPLPEFSSVGRVRIPGGNALYPPRKYNSDAS